MSGIVFLKILDMSKTACIVIPVVLLARLLLKKAPKVFSYALWSVVLFRLLCPLTFESPVSIVPEIASVSQGYSLSEASISALGAGEAAYQAVGDAVNGGLGIQHIRTTEKDETGMTGYAAADWRSVWILFGQYVWMAGLLAMGLYAAVSYFRLRRKLVTASPLRDSIYLADEITSPFVLGLIKPKIYLPSALEAREQSYILMHEQHHIRRLDHIMKALAFAALCIHWFNPLVWIAFITAGKDMEMSCDEAVIRKAGTDIRAEYAASLLSLATGRRSIAGMLLAFGEGDPKSRIRNLANWKKPALWVVLTALIVCVGLGVCLLTKPAEKADSMTYVHQDTAIGQRADFNVNLGKEAKSAVLIAEQWQNGQCTSSSPVVVSSQTEKITLLFSDRRENLNLIGENIQIDTDAAAGALVTYFAFPEHVVGWSFTTWYDEVDIPVKVGEDVILAAMTCDMGNGVRSNDCQALTREPERLLSADCMLVVRATFYDTQVPDTQEAMIEATASTVGNADEPSSVIVTAEPNYAELFAAYSQGGPLAEEAEIVLRTNKEDALTYCMVQFDAGVLNRLTFEDTGAEMRMYHFWCSSLGSDSLENVPLTPQQDWEEWSSYVKHLYELNGYDEAVFREDLVCSSLYVQLLMKQQTDPQFVDSIAGA